MAFKDVSEQQQGVQLLQRSLERGRLGHAYVFTGHQLDRLETLARTLIKTLNCQNPIKQGSVAIDCCEHCLACRKIEQANHPDVHWVRPESKSRVITIDQVREVTREIQLRSTEAVHKAAILVAADRLRVEAANAFLKTLEEPPPGSILILLTTDPQRVVETILSRCLRLNFAGQGLGPVAPDEMAWLANFSEMAAQEQKSLLGRYRLLDKLLQKLNTTKASIEEALAARSPVHRYQNVEKNVSDKWEAELAAAVEAEYRRQRVDLLVLVQWWLRDVWLRTLPPRQPSQQPEDNSQKSEFISAGIPLEGGGKHVERNGALNTDGLLSFPQIPGVQQLAQRISTTQAKQNLEVIEQLQSRLNTNVQEALVIEMSLLKLNL